MSWDVQAPDNETEEGRLLLTLEALGEASGKGWRWEHLKALGLRCTPRNIFYLAKGTDNGKQVSGQLTRRRKEMSDALLVAGSDPLPKYFGSHQIPHKAICC